MKEKFYAEGQWFKKISTMSFGITVHHKRRFWQFVPRCTTGNMLPATTASQAIKIYEELHSVHMPAIPQYLLLPVDHVMTPELFGCHLKQPNIPAFMLTN
jgi:hypothetical protein